MCCPECGKESRQKWWRGSPGSAYDPPEPAGYECRWCGHCYSGDPNGEAIDAAYDSMEVLE